MIRRELKSGSRARAEHGELIIELKVFWGVTLEKAKRGDESVNERGAISV